MLNGGQGIIAPFSCIFFWCSFGPLRLQHRKSFTYTDTPRVGVIPLVRVNAFFEISYRKGPSMAGRLQYNLENFQQYLIMCSQLSPKVEVGGEQ